MEMIRQFAVPRNGVLQVQVPEEFNEQEVEVQVILTAYARKEELNAPAKSGLGSLVGKYKHYTPEQNKKIEQELSDLRNSWERPTS